MYLLGSKFFSTRAEHYWQRMQNHFWENFFSCTFTHFPNMYFLRTVRLNNKTQEYTPFSVFHGVSSRAKTHRIRLQAYPVVLGYVRIDDYAKSNTPTRAWRILKQAFIIQKYTDKVARDELLLKIIRFFGAVYTLKKKKRLYGQFWKERLPTWTRRDLAFFEWNFFSPLATFKRKK